MTKPDVIETESPAKVKRTPKKSSKKDKRKEEKPPSSPEASNLHEEPDHTDSEDETKDDSSSKVSTNSSVKLTASNRVERFRRISYKGPKSEFQSFLKSLKKELNYATIVSSVAKINSILAAEADLHVNKCADADQHDQWVANALLRRGKMVTALVKHDKSIICMVKKGLEGTIPWSHLQSPVDITYARICTEFIGGLLESITISDSLSCDDDLEKEQKKSDRIKKNKTAFYPQKLSHASELRPFLEALLLECERIPMWKRCVSFDHYITPTYKTKERLYDFLKFHNDSSCIASMNAYNFHHEREEACYSLYLSIMASLSDEIIEEISLFQDEYKLNGPTLLLKLIDMLSPALAEIRLDTEKYFDNLLPDLTESDWNMLAKCPEIRKKVHERRNAGGSTEDLFSKVTNAMSHCEDSAFKSHHSHFMQNNPNPKANGDTVLKYLFHAAKVTKKLVQEGTWKCAVPKHHDKSSAPKSKKRKGDDDIAAFAASTKKLKQDYEAKLKSRDNTINQLKAKQAHVSEKKHDKKPSGPPKSNKASKTSKPAPTTTTDSNSDARPPRGMYSNVLTSDYYGKNCTYKTKPAWMEFVSGTNFTDNDKKTGTKHGFTVTTRHGEFTWFWCKHCDCMGGHRAIKCRNRDENGGARPAPAAYVASIASKKNKDEKEESDENYSSSENDDSEFEGEA